MAAPRTRLVQTKDSDVVVPNRTFVQAPGDPSGPRVPDTQHTRDDRPVVATFGDDDID